MGRRKIEIKAIKDDRNRSVTFLKRKGGLFKKAHELAVLCSVDVAVIIYGHNKKLHTFSSGNINEIVQRYQYYGTAHEHKGPEDFMGKKDADDEDDDDEHMLGASPPRDSHTPPDHPPMMQHHHLQNQPAYQHINHGGPTASPPMPNGPMPNGVPYHARYPSPQPGTLSRPDSRTQIHRPGSNLAPPQHPQHPQHQFSQPPPPPHSYAGMAPMPGVSAMPTPPMYAPQNPSQMHQRPPQGQGPPQPPQYQYTHPPPTAPPMQQYMPQEPRRQSGPPMFQPQPPQQQERPQPPPQMTVPSPPQPEQNDFQSPPLPQPKPLPAAARQTSIFTPIDDSRSMLAAHWGNSSSMDPPRTEAPSARMEASHRSQSIDVGGISRPAENAQQVPVSQAQRTQSTSSVPIIPPPSRTNSLQTDAAKRPRLTVQIPSENSDAGSATAGSSPKNSGTTGVTPARTSTDASNSSIILPPPSPSANSVLSAGPTGPPNPFARPPPPPPNGYGSRSDMETPVSALPSRFMDSILPSPSSLFQHEWNMLPSPLPFATPVNQNGPSFAREDASDRKRKTSDDGSDSGSGAKKAKS